ncbi:nuclear transport factor 2 family protein [Archangium gephyra]|uniref:YybH family protein n=1 Tax=Archangium gephyra TaxID=48 RepID=UPI0035D40BB1
MRRLSMLAVGMLLLSGCATTPVAPRAATPEEEALMRTDREFNAATQARGVEGWVSFFAENGSMMRDKGPITGHEAIRAAVAPGFSNPDLSLTWEPQRAEITPGGRLGYTTGRFLSVRKDANGQRVEARGTYMNIWRKQPDGSWKVVVDIGDSDEAPPPPPTKPEGQ